MGVSGAGMVDLRFFCPHCRAKLCVDDKVAGYLVDCPECGKSLEIPVASDPSMGQSSGLGEGPLLTPEEAEFLTGDA